MSTVLAATPPLADPLSGRCAADAIAAIATALVGIIAAVLMVLGG